MKLRRQKLCFTEHPRMLVMPKIRDICREKLQTWIRPKREVMFVAGGRGSRAGLPKGDDSKTLRPQMLEMMLALLGFGFALV